LTVEAYQMMAHECGLTVFDLDRMNISDVLDYVYNWVEEKKKLQEEQGGGAREATQADIDLL